MTKNYKFGVSTVITIGISLFVYGSYIRPHRSEHVHVPWGNNLKQAIALASTNAKAIMVDFNAGWCGPCQEYKEHIFNTSDFADAARSFELVDVDVDEQSKLAISYGVQPIPDIWFLNSKGQPLMHVVGYDGKDLIADMRQALDMAKQPAPQKPVAKEATDHCDD